MATTIKELQRKINEKNLQIKNLRETNKMLVAKRAIEQEELTKAQDTLKKLQDVKMEELAQEYLGVYLKYITEQHGEIRKDDETGEVIGKMFAFTFQEPNDNKFNMQPMVDDEGHITLVCAVTYPIEEEKDEKKYATKNASEQRGDKHES